MEKYAAYTVHAFLHDDDFIRWQLFRADEDEHYWRQVALRYPEQVPCMQEASRLFRKSVSLSRYERPEALTAAGVSLLLEAIRRKKRLRLHRMLWIAGSAAASLAVLLAIVFFSPSSRRPEVCEAVHLQPVKLMPADEVVLEIGDSSITLENNAQIRLDSRRITILDPKSNVVRDEEPAMPGVLNRLIVPYGKRSSVILADGSKLWVNSGTMVEYPAVFTDDSRQIRVDGEIYIEVARASGRPFTVSTSRFDVQVTGTCFDVSAYSQDPGGYVVLAEGRVTVKRADRLTRLNPDERFLTTGAGDQGTVEPVNAADFTSWRHGWLPIRSFTLSEVARQLSRYYNTDIRCEAEVARLTSSGKLRLFDHLEDVLQVLSANMGVSYRQDGDAVLLYLPEK